MLVCFSGSAVFLGKVRKAETFNVHLNPEIVWRQTFLAKKNKAIQGKMAITLDLDNRLTAKDLSANRILWEKSAEDLAVTAVPVIFETITGNTTIAITNMDGKVFALDSVSGTEIWRTDLLSEIEVSPLPLPQGLLIVACRDGRLYGLVSHSGEIFYMTAASKEVTSLEPVLDSATADSFYAVFADNSISAYSTRSGDTLWNQKAPGQLAFSPMVTKTRVIARTTEGQLQAFDKNGNLIWIDSFAPNIQVFTSADMLVVADINTLSFINAQTGSSIETIHFNQTIKDIKMDNATGTLQVPLENNTIYQRRLQETTRDY